MFRQFFKWLGHPILCSIWLFSYLWDNLPRHHRVSWWCCSPPTPPAGSSPQQTSERRWTTRLKQIFSMWFHPEITFRKDKGEIHRQIPSSFAFVSINPFLFIRGLSCPSSVQTLLTQNCLKLTIPGFPDNCLPVSCGDTGFLKKNPRSSFGLCKQFSRVILVGVTALCR